MERRLALLAAALLAVVLVGCGDQGPNDPVIKAKDLNGARSKMLTPEEQKKMAPPPDHVGGSKPPAGGKGPS